MRSIFVAFILMLLVFNMYGWNEYEYLEDYESRLQNS